MKKVFAAIVILGLCFSTTFAQALGEPAPAPQADEIRREGRHFADGFREAQELLFADVMPENAREGTCRSWVSLRRRGAIGRPIHIQDLAPCFPLLCPIVLLQIHIFVSEPHQVKVNNHHCTWHC